MYIFSNIFNRRMHEKAFRSDLSAQIKNLPFDELLFPVHCLYLVTLLYFFYDDVGVN